MHHVRTLRTQLLEKVKLFVNHDFTPSKEEQFKQLVCSLWVYTHIVNNIHIPNHDVLLPYLEGNVGNSVKLLTEIVAKYHNTKMLIDPIDEIMNVCI